MARDSPRRGCPALGQVPIAPVALRPGGKNPCPGRQRAQLRRGDRPTATDWRPRTPSIPADPSRRGPYGRDARNDSQPLGPGESPTRMGRGDRHGRRTDELDCHAARDRRDRLDDGRGSRTEVITRHAIESVTGGCRFGRFPDLARWNGVVCRDIWAGEARGSSSSPDAKSPIRARGSPATSEDRGASRPSGERHVSGPGARRGRASLPGRCVVCEHLASSNTRITRPSAPPVGRTADSDS